MTIAILAAMEAECDSLIGHMRDLQISDIAGRRYHQGKLWGKDVVIVFSRWGKVAAASTTVVLIREFKVSEIIFTGVAGAIVGELNIGDVVVGQHLYQHDLDARPLLARYEIPLIGLVGIATDDQRRTQIHNAAQTFLTTQFDDVIENTIKQEFKLDNPKVVCAGIATGDQFISSEVQAAHIRTNLSDVVCVEMEGGAVAQVCNEYNIGFSIVRTISDSANAQAGLDFPRFVNQVATAYSAAIIKNLFENDRG